MNYLITTNGHIQASHYITSCLNMEYHHQSLKDKYITIINLNTLKQAELDNNEDLVWVDIEKVEIYKK